MDYTLGVQAITHLAGPVRVLTTANAAETNGLTCLPKHREARYNKFLVTHPMTDQRCLASVIVRRSVLTAGPSNSSCFILLLLLATCWSPGNFYTFFIECFDFDILFLILFLTQFVACYTSCMSVVFSNKHSYLLAY
jgi:hypothetical protein